MTVLDGAYTKAASEADDAVRAAIATVVGSSSVSPEKRAEVAVAFKRAADPRRNALRDVVSRISRLELNQ